MSFDYATAGLADNRDWRTALDDCHAWLSKNMSMFGAERIGRFMQNQPITAAKLIMQHCPDYSEECITLALLGPAKDAAERAGRFSARTRDLYKSLIGMAKPDAAMERDITRLFLVEGLSTMNDQMIGRAKIDAHHATRWKILRALEEEFAKETGKNPGLDALFDRALTASRAALEKLDKEAS